MNWISEKLKKPLENDRNQSRDVLVYTIFGEIQVGFLFMGQWRDVNNERNLGVLYWMDLPEKPEM
jgi:hypothetical protein